MKKYIVLKEFADKNNIAKHYKPGDELPGEFGEDRLAYIVSCGLAIVKNTEPEPEAKPEPESPVAGIDLSAKVTEITAQVREFYDAEKLKQYLEAEQSAEKPRQMVVKAIEDRLAKLVKE
jgi:hypothetical protein